VTTRTLAAEQARPLAARLDGGAIGAWTLGFATVAYLGLKGGGYDVVVRSQAGIGVWWIVLIGAALGVLPQRRVGRAGLAALGLLAAFAAWSALSALWSESPERTISETARVVTLLGVAVLALSTVRAQRVRPLVNGVFAAIVGVGVLACLSRLHPAWFGEPQTATFLVGSGARLSYGLNYWNALAALMAMGVPLGLAIAVSARTAVARALALAAVPVIVLTGFFTVSRGGVLAVSVGLLVALAITPDRGRWLGKLSLAAAGAAILVKGALQRDELRNGVSTSLAHRQGDELLVIVLVVVAGIVLVHVGASLASAGGLAPSLPAVRPVRRRLAWGAVVAVVLVGAATFIGSGSLANRWQEFKSPPTVTGSDVHRLSTFSGEGRYKFWVSSLHAFETAPVVGIGAGSFENWWEAHATRRESVRNAHSLYAETLGELGLVGITLLLGLIALIIVAGVRGVRRRTGPPPALLAGATAACAAFAVAAGVDWLWQVTVLPVCFLLLAAGILAPRGQEHDRPPRRRGRVALVGLSVVALLGLGMPLAGATQLRSSQSAAAANQLVPALRQASTSRRVQPFASSPLLQRALVLELRGDFSGAASAAQTAERKEPTNWRPPFVLARIEAERGNVDAGLAALRRARALNKTASFLR
jgi:hypothetical protein